MFGGEDIMPGDYHFDKKKEGQNFQKLKIKEIFAPKFDKASVCLEIYGAWSNKAAEELKEANRLHNEAQRLKDEADAIHMVKELRKMVYTF